MDLCAFRCRNVFPENGYLFKPRSYGTWFQRGKITKTASWKYNTTTILQSCILSILTGSVTTCEERTRGMEKDSSGHDRTGQDRGRSPFDVHLREWTKIWERV